MIPWIILAAVYTLGGIGMYATACDLNGGPIRTKWKRGTIWKKLIGCA